MGRRVSAISVIRRRSRANQPTREHEREGVRFGGCADGETTTNGPMMERPVGNLRKPDDRPSSIFSDVLFAGPGGGEFSVVMNRDRRNGRLQIKQICRVPRRRHRNERGDRRSVSRWGSSSWRLFFPLACGCSRRLCRLLRRVVFLRGDFLFIRFFDQRANGFLPNTLAPGWNCQTRLPV